MPHLPVRWGAQQIPLPSQTHTYIFFSAHVKTEKYIYICVAKNNVRISDVFSEVYRWQNANEWITKNESTLKEEWCNNLCKVYERNGSYTRMLRNVLNKSWKQHPTNQQLYNHLLPMSQTIQDMLGTVGESETKFSNRPQHMDTPPLTDQQEFTFISTVRILDSVKRTCLARYRWLGQMERGRIRGTHAVSTTWLFVCLPVFRICWLLSWWIKGDIL